MAIVSKWGWQILRDQTEESLKEFHEACRHEPVDDGDPDLPFPTAEELKQFKPDNPRWRRKHPPQPPERKQPVSMYFEAKTLKHLRASGKGWQTRVSDFIAKSVKSGAL
jgi:uncharacterized protein (DUF4415 family)